MMNTKINKIQILIGFLTLFIGLLIYILDRHFIPILSIPVEIELFNKPVKLLSTILGFVPSLIHTFSFSLITAGLIGGGKKVYFFTCLGWTSINLFFEIFQTPALSSWFHKSFGVFSEKSIIVRYLDFYFYNGIFDILDIISIFIGGFLALFILINSNQTN